MVELVERLFRVREILLEEFSLIWQVISVISDVLQLIVDGVLKTLEERHFISIVQERMRNVRIRRLTAVIRIH